MRRQRTSLAAGGVDQVDLPGAAALSQERNPLSVGRPSRTVLAAGPVGELFGLPESDIDPPDVRDMPVGGPVSLAEHVHQLAPVGGQLRIVEIRRVEQIHHRHGPPGLGECRGPATSEDSDCRKEMPPQ